MRTFFLCAFIVCSLLTNGQRFEKNEIDKFNKAHRLTTSNARLKTGMLAYLRSFTKDGETSYFITLFGSVPEAHVVGTDDPAIFLLENDSTVTVYPTDIQSYEIGKGTYGKMYRHQYRAFESDIEKLSKWNIKSIRKHGGDVYADVEIPDRNKDEIKKLALLMLNELKK